jgi:hypothetical protein
MQKELSFHSHAITLNLVNVCRDARFCTVILALACTLTGATLPAKDKPPVQHKIAVPALPDFSALIWLQGRWAGKTAEKSPPGFVQLSVAPDLENHFLIFRGEVSLSATPNAPATKDSWIGILSAGPSAVEFVLRMFSSKGFISRYQLAVSPTEIRLNPEGGDAPPPGWLFRMVWLRTGADEFAETVQAAPPGKAFFDWFTAKFSRVSPAAKSDSAIADSPKSDSAKAQPAP